MLDTHAAFQRLRAAGTDVPLAEAIVELATSLSLPRSIPIDTSAAVKRLQAAGADERVAEAIVELFASLDPLAERA